MQKEKSMIMIKLVLPFLLEGSLCLLLKTKETKDLIMEEIDSAEGMCHGYPAIPDKTSRDTLISLQKFIANHLG